MATEDESALVLSRQDYQQLLTDLRGLLEAGRMRAEEAVSHELARTYHALGARIVAERLTVRSGYFGTILAELADELGLRLRVLQEAVRFARLYPDLPRLASGLRWNHYRELLRVKDGAARAWYAAQTKAGGWGYRKLAEAIRRDSYAEQRDAAAPTGAAQPAKLPRPEEATYVYKAQVERVVDGDTVILLIDLGFDVLKRQRVRLARVDTPPLRESAGRRAKDFVRDTLAQVEFVVVKTNKIDLYGRYVGHIFYAPGVEDEQRVFSEGTYLNAQLLERGLATVL